jgi:DNA-binding GntR family transcriptional regulator
MINKIVRTPNLTELTYRSIKRTVLLDGVDRPFRLTEEYLANRLGISKSPVREALNRLEAEGLIRIEARRGAYVRQFAAKEIRDLYDLRALLEDHSMATAVITPALLAELAASIARTEKILAEGDRLKHIEEDLRFHFLITEATGNQELGHVFDNVQQKSVLCRMESYQLSATRSPAAHKRIYQALLRGDRQEARRAMQEHILYVRDRLLASAEARPGSLPAALPKRISSRSASPQPSRSSRARLTRSSTSSNGKAKVKAKGLESILRDPLEQLGRSPASS